MSELNIKLSGSVPSKKNSRQCFVRNGRMLNIPSKAYTEWHNYANIQLIGQLKEIAKPIEKVEEMIVEFWSKDKRKWDLSNKFESIADLLVDNGILLDDNYTVISDIHIKFMGQDEKKVGKTQIKIIY